VLTTLPTCSESFSKAFTEMYLRLSDMTLIRGNYRPSTDFA
jgi:hypothetical protein